MKKFCGKCGAPLDAEGKCAKCGFRAEDSTEKKSSKPVKKDTKNNPKKKVNLIFLIVILVLSLYTVTMITLGTLVYMNKINIPFMNDMFVFWGWKDEVIAETAPVAGEGETPDSPTYQPPEQPVDDGSPDKYKVTPPDADEYFANNATVVSDFTVDSSADVHSESDTYDNLTDRGFGQYDIVAKYSMDGELLDPVSISRYSSTQHPMYETWYVSSSGVVWQILEINGVVIANRFMESNPVLVSETNTITSYDSTKNKFYVNTPNASVAKLVTVARVDAATLDALN